MTGLLLLAAYAATIPAANWMIGHIGTCSPDGPCVIAVGFGLCAPSGVILVGAALVLRDLVQMVRGWRTGLWAIVIGTAVSSVFAPPSLVLASLTAFALSEFADFAIYTPLARKHLSIAFFASGFVGAVIDSIVFLSLAFGSIDFLAGQVLGKAYASVAAAIIITIVRRQQKFADQPTGTK